MEHFDIIALIFSLAGIYLNAKKIIWCWPVWIGSDVFWIIYFLPKQEWSSIVLWLVFGLMNIYGWLQWKKSAKVTN